MSFFPESDDDRCEAMLAPEARDESPRRCKSRALYARDGLCVCWNHTRSPLFLEWNDVVAFERVQRLRRSSCDRVLRRLESMSQPGDISYEQVLERLIADAADRAGAA